MAADSGLPYVGMPADVDRKTLYQSPFDQSTQDAYRLRLDAEHRVGKTFLLRNKLYYTDLAVSDGTAHRRVPLPFPGRGLRVPHPGLPERPSEDPGDQIEGVCPSTRARWPMSSSPVSS